MVDIDKIRKRAQAASQQAADTMKKVFDESEETTRGIIKSVSETKEHRPASEVEEQIDANTQRQVEILGQMLGPDGMAQFAANEELLQKMVDEKVSEAAGLGADAVMEQLFGEDMGVIAAALETLAAEDGDDEELDFCEGLEETLYTLLEETMSRIEALPEPEPVTYPKDAAAWEHFGILLSGIVSNLNRHDLRGMDVEEHIPVMEQQVVSIVRRSWGIDGRSDLLDMLRYLSQEGYILRYRLYSEAASPEELMDEDADDEDREAVRRTWRFAQRYKSRYAPGFLAGWDIGRAAMLARWGSYLGWITESEAVGILWDLSQQAAEELHSWREFAQSYLFGGLMWKLQCGDSSAASYLGFISDAATDLLTGKADQGGGQWRGCPWPARRKIGFTF